MNGHDSSHPTEPDPSASRHAKDRAGLAIDQDIADHDRATADTDQTVSDVDQAASERDDADANRDQRSADRDQASADALRTGAVGPGKPGDLDEVYQTTSAERTASRIGRLKSHQGRVGASETRLAASRGRDRNAERRDDAAGRRDVRAVELESELAATEAPALEQLEQWRRRAGADRAAAAADRQRAAAERTEAAVELAQLRSDLHRAYLDDLTGAFGRAMGDHVLGLEMDRSRRGDGRLVLAFVDVDGLKAINDRAGHAAGDHVLRTLVATMRSSLRSFDPIVRYGGDEFVCAAAGVGIEEVNERFGAIRDSLYADTGASVSVGLASLDDGETLEELTARADALLLTAKRTRPN